MSEPKAPPNTDLEPGTVAAVGASLAPYHIRLAVFRSGERMPLLYSRETGLPLAEVTLFLVLGPRRKPRAHRTMKKYVAAIQFLLCFAWVEGFDLFDRIASGDFLSLAEIDRFSSAVRRPLRDVLAEGAGPTPVPRLLRLGNLERARAAPVPPAPSVAPPTAAVRLNYAYVFLEWFTKRRAAELLDRPAQQSVYETARDSFLSSFGAERPGRCASSSTREAPPAEVIAQLIEVVHPESPRNPWTHELVRQRNFVIVRWLVELGLRGGELLSLRVPDLDFSQGEVAIIRRPDSPEDPRRDQPNVKGHGHRLILMDLEALTRSYVNAVRRKIPGATKNRILFQDIRSGQPLSASALGKLVRQLGEALDPPIRLSPHLLRHAWNTAFSRHCDEMGIGEKEEREMREEMMGWNEGSEAAVTYTKRHVREKAMEILKAMNDRLMAKVRLP